MAEAVKVGTRWSDATTGIEVMVVKAPADGAQLDVVAGEAAGTKLGKRYVDASGDTEVLCIKPGDGVLHCGGAPMVLKEAKPLPASD